MSSHPTRLPHASYVLELDFADFARPIKVDFTDLAVTLRRKTSRNQVEIYVEIGLKTPLCTYSL
jgi:hypothetical protein